MKHVYQSGAEKRKIAENKRKAVSSLPRVTSFFRPAPITTAAAAAPGPSHDDASQTTESTNEGDHSTDPSDNDHVQIGSFEQRGSQTTDERDATKKVLNLSFAETDPACWPENITSDQRLDIVRRGPVQIEDVNFPQSQTHCRFTRDRYFMRMKNGEKIRRS